MQISNNNIFSQDGMVFKTHHEKKPVFKSHLKRFLRLGDCLPVEYQTPLMRARFEAKALLLWEKYDVAAPRLIKLVGTTVVMSKIDGEELSPSLLDSVSDREFLLSEISKNLYRRHALAIEDEHKSLIHIDANPKNLLLRADGEVVHLDFEMGRLCESISEWKRREIFKLLSSFGGVYGEQIEVELYSFLEDSGIEKSMLEEYQAWRARRN